MDQTNPLSELTHKRRLSRAGAGRSEPRARRLRGARRAQPPLRPHLPDRDAGRSEHRPDLLAEHLCPGQRVRVHREPVPQGREGQGDRQGRLPDRGPGGEAIVIAQANAPLDEKGNFIDEHGHRCATAATSSKSRRTAVDYMDVSPKQLVSVAAGLIPVPGARRRQPRADGLEHAAPGGAAAGDRAPLRGHRHGRQGGPGLPRCGRRPKAGKVAVVSADRSS